MPRRSSTAGSSHDGVYRRTPQCLRGRADLQGIADRPLDVHLHAARRADPSRASARAQADTQLCAAIGRIWEDNRRVYGVRKVWRQLQRDCVEVARCTVERLMRRLGLRGVVRGKAVRTIDSDKAQPCPLDRVNRQFHAARPNAL